MNFAHDDGEHDMDIDDQDDGTTDAIRIPDDDGYLYQPTSTMTTTRSENPTSLPLTTRTSRRSRKTTRSTTMPSPRCARSRGCVDQISSARGFSTRALRKAQRLEPSESLACCDDGAEARLVGDPRGDAPAGPRSPFRGRQRGLRRHQGRLSEHGLGPIK